jgi:putative sigma-54 modulation protein
MSTRIKGRHVKITKEVREYIESKLPRIEKYADRVHGIDVVIEKDAYQHKAELMLKDGPISVTVTTRDPNLMRAVDLLVDKAEAQLKKKWAKLRGGKKRGRTAASPAPAPEAPPRAVLKAPRSLKAVPLVMPTLSIAEAAESLAESGDTFLPFINSGDGRWLIIHRSDNGSLRLMEPVEK